MRIFKRTWTDRAGKRQQTRHYYIEIVDHNGLSRRLPATSDKRASSEFGRKVEKLVALRQAGEEPDGDLAAWLEALDAKTIERLAKWDIVDPRRLAAGKPLAEHVEDYRQWLKGRGRSEKHVHITIQRVMRVVEAAGVDRWSGLRGRIESALAKVKADHGLSDRSRNYHLTAFKTFCRWMVKQGRASKSPAEHVEALQVEAREHRRALSDAEAARLIAAAAEGDVLTGPGGRWSMSGPERGALYALTIQTGFRNGELHALKVSSFDLDAKPATVTLPASATKNRKAATAALQPGTAEALRGIIAGKHPDAPPFDLPGPHDMADMLRHDLAEARAAWIAEADNAEDRHKRAESDFLAAEDAEGRRVDFHALRATTATLLALADVPRAVAQKHMRHASYATTDKHYNRIADDQSQATVERLPELLPEPIQLQATGTDDAHAEGDSVDRPADRIAGLNMMTHAERSGPKSLILSQNPGRSGGIGRRGGFKIR